MDVVIIPAYNPEQCLIDLIVKLQAFQIQEIIVVDDGSDVFHKENVLTKLPPDIILISHEKNCGKGAAIKTALSYLQQKEMQEIAATAIYAGSCQQSKRVIITMDADGQHRPEDALELLREARQKESTLVLGTRTFDQKVPFRSLFGNLVTRGFFRLFSGTWVSDTQTGLRAFSYRQLSFLLSVEGERYEYEMNVLIKWIKMKYSIVEVPIQTVYLDQHNTCSHFRIVQDSVRIYGSLFLFAGASFLSFLVDYVMFFLFASLFSSVMGNTAAILCGNVSARFLSAGVNYYLNSRYVFQKQRPGLQSAASYFMLAGFILCMNSLLLYVLYDAFGFTRAQAKILTELLLFVISYIIQKYVIFHAKGKGLHNSFSHLKKMLGDRMSPRKV